MEKTATKPIATASQSSSITGASAVVERPAAQPKPALPLGGVASNQEQVLWYDSRALTALPEIVHQAVVQRVLQNRFNGFILYADNLKELGAFKSSRVRRVLQVENPDQWSQLEAFVAPTAGQDRIEIAIVSSNDFQVLALAATAGYRTCLRTHVDNAESLHASFKNGGKYDYLLVSFKDSTNIPLELVIAELHPTNTVLLKETGSDIDDGVIALSVLELGSDGVVVTFTSMAEFDGFFLKLDARKGSKFEIEVGTIVGTTHLGPGFRACIDTTHLFEPNEGILVGSTSSGGFLCCPEVFFLPYMELRPFRINAASVHSYVFQSNDRTSYITELRAGSALTAIDVHGNSREIFVGRVKTEIRPLILIEAVFPGERHINIIMQDDWHVRIFSDQAQPLNVTELKPGNRVLGFGSTPGRHVGVKVDEQIIEV
ncbi:MAG: 3-dehydroquinate synthase [Prolixibacteraceae bacterium]|nr:3-dehydroquinate synthase [Burkholderiales bacterium]